MKNSILVLALNQQITLPKKIVGPVQMIRRHTPRTIPSKFNLMSGEFLFDERIVFVI
jgi:hypothetical protein